MEMADKDWCFFQDYGEYAGKIQRSSMERNIEASHKRNEGWVPQEYQSGTTSSQIMHVHVS